LGSELDFFCFVFVVVVASLSDILTWSWSSLECISGFIASFYYPLVVIVNVNCCEKLRLWRFGEFVVPGCVSNIWSVRLLFVNFFHEPCLALLMEV
jgi:hypothetical protein